jgi:hypothetical protein
MTLLPVAASLAALLHGAELDLAWGARAEARATARGPDLDTVGRWSRTNPQQQAVVTPRAAAALATSELRLSLEYAPRFWSSDLSSGQTPFVNHVAAASIETPHGRPFELTLGASGIHGHTDPIDDVLRAQAAGVNTTQLPALRPIAFEHLGTRAHAQLATGERDTVEAEASWGVARAVAPEDRGLFPTQRELAFGVGETHLLTERTTLALQVRAVHSTTNAALGQAVGDTVNATLTDRWRATPETVLWAGAGAAYLRMQQPDVSSELRPTGTVGAMTGSGTGLTASASVTATTMFDRFTGTAVPIFEGIATVRWTARPSLDLLATVTGTSRTDGVTTLGTGDLRAVWTVHQSVLVEAGTIGRWQRDRRAAQQSMIEIAPFVGVMYMSDLAYGRQQQPGARPPGAGPAGAAPGPGLDAPPTDSAPGATAPATP